MHSSQGKKRGGGMRRGSCYYHQIHWYNTHSNKLCAIDKRPNLSAELSKPKALFHRKWEITRMRINGLHVIHIWKSCYTTTNKIAQADFVDEKKNDVFFLSFFHSHEISWHHDLYLTCYRARRWVFCRFHDIYAKIGVFRCLISF